MRRAKFFTAMALSAIVLTGCSTEEQMKQDAQNERLAEKSESAGPDEVEELSKLESTSIDIRAEVAEYRERRNRLPLDLYDFINPLTTKLHVSEITWDTENYNVCLVDKKTNEAAIIQTSLDNGETRFLPAKDACENLEATRAADTYNSVEESLMRILSPVTSPAFSNRRFDEKLAEVIANPKFGRARIVSTGATDSDEGMVFQKQVSNVMEVASADGKEKVGLAYACVTINDVSKIRMTAFSRGGIVSSEYFIAKSKCNVKDVRAEALSWWDSMKI